MSPAARRRSAVIREMVREQCALDLRSKIAVDLFAGGGGASLGYELATGRQVDIAVNHDAAAVALHAANHPDTHHVTSDVFEVDPREVTKGQLVGILWASPDCTFHSKARGGKPFRSQETKRRSLAWIVIRWAGQVAPDVILLENVEEFAFWGPLVGPPNRQRPCPRRRGRTFRTWKRALQRLGYVVEHREQRACDYGDPTIRKRLFVIARRDGKPIVWPEATHGPERAQPYRTAAECIDWSIPMPSIFLTKAQARAWGKSHGVPAPKRPLAKATNRRIARGTDRFVVRNPKPFLVSVAHGDSGGRREYPLDTPLGTVQAQGNAHAVVAPVLIRNQTGRSAPARAVDEPMGTVLAHGANPRLIAPILAHLTHQGPERSHPLEAPTPTVTGAQRGELGLVAPVIVPNNTNNAPHAVDGPLPTVTGGGRHILAAPMLVPRYGERAGQDPRVRDIEQPAPTIVPTGNGGDLVAAFLAKHYGGHETPGARLDQPISTLTTQDHHHLVAAHLTTFQRHSTGSDAESPLGTVTAGAEHHGVVAAHLSTYYGGDGGDGRGADPAEPLRTQGAENRFALVYAFMQKYHGQGTGQQVDRPASTVTTKDRIGLVLVTVNGQSFYIDDIGMRMLQPRELYNCQGFPPDYQIQVYFYDAKKAKWRWLTKTEQVRMVGNSVCPGHAAALIRANCPELVADPGVPRRWRIAA